MTFEEAYSASALQDAFTNMPIHPEWKPVLTEQAADLHVQIAKLENIAVDLVSFTHLCENSFSIRPKPNDNKRPTSPWDFDIGPFALNLGWTMRAVFQGDYSAKGLAFKDVFGDFYEGDGITPNVFSGDALANGRLAARRLLSFRGNPSSLGYTSAGKMLAVRYTGPGPAQEHRAVLYDALISLFQKFFELYGG